MTDPNHYSSQHSSSEYSQTPFTPSETLFTPSNSLHDRSQPSLPVEHEISDASQNDGVAPGRGLSTDDSGYMTRFAVHGSGTIEVPAFSLEQGHHQDMWEATIDEQFGQHIQPNYRASLHHDTGAQFNFDDVAANVRPVQAHLADFHQSIDRIPEQHISQPLGPTSSTATQWVPHASNTASYPGLSDLLPRWGLDHPPSDGGLIHGSARHLPATMQYDPMVTRHNEVYPLNEYSNQGICLDMPAIEDTIDPPPPPDPVGPPVRASNERDHAPKRGTRDQNRRGRRRGGLCLQSRQNAKSRRKGGVCWRCALTRDQCQFKNDGAKVCIRCQNMCGQSLLSKCIIVRLPDLIGFFIPASLAQQYDPQSLLTFASEGLHRCRKDSRIEVLVTWGYFRPIKCSTVEFEPKGMSLLYQNQWRLNQEGRYDDVPVPSPPLGMEVMAIGEWRQRLNGYLEEALQEENFRGFPTVCFRGEDCGVERDFLIPIFEYHNLTTDTKAQFLVHQSLKLVVLTHIMTHSLTLVENTRDDVHRRLKNPPPVAFGQHTSPRLLNRQIKFLLSTLHHDLLKGILQRIQEALRHSSKKPSWAALFASMVVLAMTTESQEVAVRCKESTDKKERVIEVDDSTAEKAIGLMDEQFEFLSKLFHQRYRTPFKKGFNPLLNVDNRNELDIESRLLADKSAEIVKTYQHFLIARQTLDPPKTAREPQTARLVAKFLLQFYPPEYQHSHQPADPDGREQQTTWT